MARHDKMNQDNTPGCSNVFSIMMRTQRGHRTREQELKAEEAKRQRRGRLGQYITSKGNDLINNVHLIHGDIRSTETMQHLPASRLYLIKILFACLVCDPLIPQICQDKSECQCAPTKDAKNLRFYSTLLDALHIKHLVW